MGIRNAWDNMQQKRVAEDRAFLEECVDRLRAVSFQNCRGRIDEIDLKKYQVQVQEMAKKLHNADITRTDTWDVDHEIEKIVGELGEAVRTRSRQTIESCLLGLSYAVSVRTTEIPVHLSARKEMQERLERLDIYITIINCSKAIDNAERSVEQQEQERIRVDREREAARIAAIQLREQEPAAAEEVDNFGTEIGHTFSGKSREIQTLMNGALDLRDRLTELDQMIATNKQQIQALQSQISQSRIQLTQRKTVLTQEELERIREAQERMLHQMSSMMEDAEKLRAQTRGSVEQIKALASSEEVVMSMMRTSEAFQKEEAAIEEKAQRDAEARGRMLERKRIEAERRAQKERELQEQMEQNRQMLDELEGGGDLEDEVDLTY